MSQSPPRTDYLPLGASRSRLIRAAAENHVHWFVANARASGGEILETQGVRWMVADRQATIAFPQLEPAGAGDALNAIVGECFERKLNGASCWALSPTQPRDLGVQLAARGFEWGWRPHWMARELGESIVVKVPDGVEIVRDDACDWDVEDLPYYSRDGAGNLRALLQQEPRRTWHFAALQDGKIVGQSAVYLTEGRYGVAGIYNVGVVPSARGRGIGSAVSLAACQFAQGHGCRYALLNSAADGLYDSLEFQSLGYGQTWWMHAPTLSATPPTPAQIAFAEVIGRGDMVALDALDRTALPVDLNAPLSNGSTPMEFAVQARKPAVAEWLAIKGATLDPIHAWTLGWKARARALFRASPERVNQRPGNGDNTLLHDAVWRNDIAWVRLLLDFAPDLNAEDNQFHSTPLGWARHLHRTEIAALLEQHASTRP